MYCTQAADVTTRGLLDNETESYPRTTSCTVTLRLTGFLQVMGTVIRLSRDSSIHHKAVYAHHIGCSGFLQKLLDPNLVDGFPVDTRTPKPGPGAHNLLESVA